MKLEIQNGKFGYGGNAVLQDVNFELNTGEIVCLLGKNGAGKTTLFKSMLGVLKPLSGSILLNGKPIEHWNRQQFARLVGYIPQARSLPFPFTVMDVVLFGRTAHLSAFGSPGKRDRILAGECMDLLNITHLQHRTFTHLSGGEQQLVIIARALAQQPAFLIMDEPTSSLDFGNQINIIRQVNALKNNALGIMMATHSPDHAFMCNANVAVVHQGTLRKAGHANDIISEQVLKEIYGVDVKVRPLDDTRLVCVPEV
ncbi:ABC transporter related protein [Paludibacter propionicigenes WB4]|uniref:ABC transporter related protein n=1 Tax=Paludibacter propionicigenes (strain DSM 17365 / JCM 13257 / WB4) TaxID=694427 RepID=E4T1R9_PALPW|nr:ABC transporter ATP-binding protein [Paludibacter propionicigenes]ADQ78663.1 ABC transporter related protein [Paludibacter propionicigenes WB4]